MRRIPSAKDKCDKGNTYSKLLKRQKEAMEAGFYLEALVLDYAMIEDRLSEMLLKIGLVEIGEKSLVVIEKYTDDVRILLNEKDKNGDGKPEKIDSIFKKIKIIRKLKIKGKLYSEGIALMANVLISADDNRKIRKQYIHAFYSKHYDSAIVLIPEVVEEGMDLAGELDNYSGRVKTQINKRKERL